MKVKTSEAIAMAHEGKSLKNIVLEDINDVQVNVRDVMALSNQGIVVPEANIFYDDSEIEYDEDIDGLERIGELRKMTWEEKEAFFTGKEIEETESLVNLTTDQAEINTWIANNKSRLEEILKPVVIGLFKAERMVKGEG